MTKKRLFIFAYDVSDNKKRNKIAKILELEGVRVQGSVFELRIKHEQAVRLGKQLKVFLDIGDSLRIYHVPDRVLRFCVSYGGAPMAQAGDYLLF